MQDLKFCVEMEKLVGQLACVIVFWAKESGECKAALKHQKQFPRMDIIEGEKCGRPIYTDWCWLGDQKDRLEIGQDG